MPRGKPTLNMEYLDGVTLKYRIGGSPVDINIFTTKRGFLFWSVNTTEYGVLRD